MQYIRLKEALKSFTVFSVDDIKKVDANFYRRRLNEWQAKGYIKKIVKGHYVFSDLQINENVLFEIANKIYRPSYVSFEAALSYYNLIPEIVYGVTSVSTRRTYNFKAPAAGFSYRTLKPKLFFGYDLVGYNGHNFKMASAEKALLDYLYINNNLKNKNDFSAMRVNKDNFLKRVDEKIVRKMLKRFSKKALTNRVNLFLEFMENA